MRHAPKRVSLHDPHQRGRGREHLRGVDRQLRAWIDRHGDVGPPRPAPAFALLCSSILGQQISVGAARTIRRRVSEALGGHWNARAVRALSDSQWRACGVSRQKRAALRDLAARVEEGRLRPSQLWRRDDESVIAELTSVRGIGRWTAEMFLIFGLGRPDVLSTGDLGLQTAVARLIGAPSRPRGREFVERAEAWRPWRSLASLHLWRELDGPPTSAGPE